MPVLVVTQALAGAGKTTVARHLERLGFLRLCVEDDLKRSYGTRWWQRTRRKDGWWWDAVFERAVFAPAGRALRRGRSVVVDTMIGATKWPEGHYRLENLFLRSSGAERYLLELKARRAIRLNRVAGRQRIPRAQAVQWDSSQAWRQRWQPRGLPVSVLCYRNESLRDLARIERDLDARFGKRARLASASTA